MWLDPSAYPFTAMLEEQHEAILEELRAVIDRKAWVVWTEGPDRPATSERTQIGDGEAPKWRLFGLYLRGAPIPPHCALCPRTAALLAKVPKLTKAGFACLEAGYVMKPHIGHDPHNYRVHLGLIVPDGDCGMRVGDETRTWQRGKVTMFDDNQLHDAWNRTPQHRYVLIVDVVH